MSQSNAAYIRTQFPWTTNPTDLNHVGWFDEDEVQHWQVIMPKVRIFTPQLKAVFKSKMMHLAGAIIGYGDTEDAAEEMLRKNIEKVQINDRKLFVDTYYNAMLGMGEIEGFSFKEEQTMSLSTAFTEGKHKIKYVGDLVYATPEILESLGIALVMFSRDDNIYATYLDHKWAVKYGCIMNSLLSANIDEEFFFDWQVGKGKNMVQALNNLYQNGKNKEFDGWAMVCIANVTNVLNRGNV